MSGFANLDYKSTTTHLVFAMTEVGHAKAECKIRNTLYI
jgi:hypothetical protein